MAKGEDFKIDFYSQQGCKADDESEVDGTMGTRQLVNTVVFQG